MTVGQAVEVLIELSEDSAVPKNVRAKLATTAESLTKETSGLVVAKALEQLETISENLNIEPFVRTELFNVVSLLEAQN